MRQNQQHSLEIDIELTTQQLLAPLGADEVLEIDVLEIDDVGAIATTCESEPAANGEVAANQALDETSEIELTPEQMDAMIEGRWPI
jgi:hypothetical protein